MGPWAWFQARLGDRPVRADRSARPRQRTRRAARPARHLDARRARDRPADRAHVAAGRAVPDALRRGLPPADRDRVPPGLALRDLARDLRVDAPAPRQVRDGRSGSWPSARTRSGATSQLGVAVVDAAIEPRRDDGLGRRRDRGRPAVGRDRQRGPRLRPRRRAGSPATLDLPGAVALAYDDAGARAVRRDARRARSGRSTRRRWTSTRRRAAGRGRLARVHGPSTRPIAKLFLTRDGERLAVVLAPGSGATDARSQRARASSTRRRRSSSPGRACPASTQVTDHVSGQHDRRRRRPTAWRSSRRSTGDGRRHARRSAARSTASSASTTSRTTRSTPRSRRPTARRSRVVIAKRGENPRARSTRSCCRAPRPAAPTSTWRRAWSTSRARCPVEPDATGDRRRSTSSSPTATRSTRTRRCPTCRRRSSWTTTRSTRPPIASSSSRSTPAAAWRRSRSGKHAYAWRVPGVIAGVLMALFLYVLARLLFRRRSGRGASSAIDRPGRRHALRPEPDRHERLVRRARDRRRVHDLRRAVAASRGTAAATGWRSPSACR